MSDIITSTKYLHLQLSFDHINRLFMTCEHTYTLTYAVSNGALIDLFANTRLYVVKNRELAGD